MTFEGVSIEETSVREPPSTRKEESSTDKFDSLSHGAWTCECRVVLNRRRRRRTPYGQLRQHLGEVLRKLASQRDGRIEAGHLMPDHVHTMISIPPRHAVSQAMGCIEGKSATHLARVYGQRKQLRREALPGTRRLCNHRRARRA